ncbi:MAG: L-histidine N(alpha)-methyltransferase [Terriglobales bacterium]
MVTARNPLTAPALAPIAAETADLAATVMFGLQQPQKKLPPRFFYDAVGSALFEAICLLPEYGLTRADERLLRRHATGILARMGTPLAIAELGSGSGRKTRWLLEALLARPTRLRPSYYPIEISPSALEQCALALETLPGLDVIPQAADYLVGLQEVVRQTAPDVRLLVLFLGSSIGNFEPAEADGFLRSVRRLLRPGDALLVGTDLVKDVSTLIAAYDDAAGVTAAFNRNLLGRLNRELEGDFDLAAFDHHVRYDSRRQRIEMHLRARTRQEVHLRGLPLAVSFTAGETIWTESSHKYRPADLPGLAERNGFALTAQWVDAEWPFAENLFAVR